MYNVLSISDSGDPLLQKWITEAWGEIERDVWQQLGDYPGNLFFPGNFKDCHRYKTLANVYFATSFGDETDEDWVKHERLSKLGADAYRQAITRYAHDWDDDGILDTDEGDFAGAVIAVIR